MPAWLVPILDLCVPVVVIVAILLTNSIKKEKPMVDENQIKY